MDPGVLPGRSYPLGATVYPDGVNFSIFSQKSVAMELLLFNDADDAAPAQVIQLDPIRNRTFYYWHVFVPGIGERQLYGFRAHGPFAPERGHRFDSEKVLLDPYTCAVAVGANYDRDAAIRPGDNCAHALKSIVLDPSSYDWEGDTPLHLPYSRSVIYELHVGGFTRHPNSGVAPEKRGTFAGLVEKIPYLQELGVTAVELLPVQQFDEHDAPPPHRNYWGYSPVAFFAPHHGYSHRRDLLGPVEEFRDMIKAFHRAGIEVILDVVFNHTHEGDEHGPTVSFKGLENEAYYILDEDRSQYANYSGCGNSINSNHSIVRRFILDCLRYWVSEMHVDGFRFDLASVLSRDENGQPMEDPPILWSIESDPVLAGSKIIAEAWDAAGLYQVGSFIGDRFAEWNGQYRDDLRRLLKGESGISGAVVQRIMGSPDLYRQPYRDPNRSINFVTCHDGFTLNDLVSYNQKHNEANGENNRDGSNDNHSWNCGVEGPSDDAEVAALRLRQMKNFLTILFMSQGTPMIAMGDEVRRTQRGNNNTYCQNNELSWFDWSAVDREVDLFRFVQGLIHFTKSRSLFQMQYFWTTTNGDRDSCIMWHGTRLAKPDWGTDSRSLAFELRCPTGDTHLQVMFNAFWKPLSFELPPLANGKGWRRLIDTALASPDDFNVPEVAPPYAGRKYLLQPHSTVVLVAG
ncbi:MAG: glycogen debranching protein GlgX [bacterium]